MMRTMASVGVVVVGNEVLAGRVEEQNARYLSRALREAGATLERITVVPDDAAQIANDVREMTARFDFVLAPQ